MEKFILIVCSCLLLITTLLFAGEPHTPVEKWKVPRLYHSSFDSKFDEQIRIANSSWPTMSLQHNFSTNKAYWFGVIRPDTKKSGPWTTRIFINNEKDRPVQIDIVNHGSYPVDIRWINEKLIYVQVWWGRVIGTYFIYDTESEKVLIKEMVEDGAILFNQYQQFKAANKSK